MRAEKRIAVVVPARNEERFIERVIAGMPGFVDVVVVVDDGSRDRTFERATAAGDPRVTLVRHARNKGVGAAIVTGVHHALSVDVGAIAVMAGDDQMDPADLESVVDPVLSGRADYVKGNRFVHPERRRMPWLRRVVGAGLATVTSAATGFQIGDSQCGYAALSKETAERLPLGELWPGYGYPNDLLGLIAAHDMRVVEVPVRPVYADEKSGIRPWHLFTILAVIARRFWRSRTRRLQSPAARATIASAHFKV
jgi:glycosyltransferase involved in cell wall biosynthesis